MAVGKRAVPGADCDCNEKIKVRGICLLIVKYMYY